MQSRQKLKRNQDRERKELFRIEFFSYGVKLEEDVDFVHPRLVCQSCSRYFYRLRSSGHPPESHSLPFTWGTTYCSEEDENCVDESLSPRYTT